MVLVDKTLLRAVTSSTIHDITWSDHAPVSISLVEGAAPSPAYIWRANAGVFQSQAQVNCISSHLKEFFELNVGSVSDPSVL